MAFACWEYKAIQKFERQCYHQLVLQETRYSEFQSSTLLQETDSGQRNPLTSTNGECPANRTQAQSTSEIISDIEGLKLDFLILQKQVEANTNLLSMENIQKQDENALGAELLDYKKKCEKLLSTISKKDNAIKELEENVCSLKAELCPLSKKTIL